MEKQDTQDIKKRFNGVAHSRTFAHARRFAGLQHKRTLDVGCGYGEYLVSFGEGSVGITTTPAEWEYGVAHGIAIMRGNAEELETLSFPRPFEAVWANNVFEHLIAPHAFLIKLKTVVTPQALLVLGVPTVPLVSPLMNLKKFRGALAVGHINFFNLPTLRLTVQRAGWKIRTIRPFLFSNPLLDYLMLPLAPHLYVVAENDPTFRYQDKKLKEWEGEEHYRGLIELTKG